MRILLGLVAMTLGNFVQAQDTQSVREAMKKAATHYREKIASHGGYTYYTSLDLKDRWGEGKFDANTVFVQPPGTPTVGLAYLRAYAATKDTYYLDAARETANCLVYGQLQSGGWTQTIHFAKVNRMGKYRNGKGGNWNNSSLDDGQTQAALLMLIRADAALKFEDATIHEATEYGLNALLKAQYANGAFPQIWSAPVPEKPILKAKFPEYDWKTEGRVKNYFDYYTLNDNLAGTIATTLIEAHTVYQLPKYEIALKKLGDFLIAAQMPDPQPGWCQQYNYEMVPIWARKFEPPAITGWESQDVMETLIRISHYTGEKKYLEPIPRALEYYTKNLLPDGRAARYYEFRTNKPLYMDERYQLTYDDSAAPSHYGWKQPARFDTIRKQYDAAKEGRALKPAVQDLSEATKTIVASLNAEGYWVTTYNGERLVGQPKFANGFRYISSGVFSENLTTLSEHLLSLNSR
jgi:PelA/Pel-15E family pectate lyase